MVDFVWNGVGLAAPEGWEPAAIEKDALIFEDRGVPVCELKWNAVQGTFSFDRHLKRLIKGNKGAALQAVPEDETPQAWAKGIERLAESGIRAKSFIWQAVTGRGIGAALHNPATGLAILVQFFIHGESDEATAAAVLASLRDHTGGKTIPWAMFGLRARVPAEFRLDTFSFRPGHYMVKYWRPGNPKLAGNAPAGKGPGTHLVFERFAPASVLLKGTSLPEWCRETLKDAPPESVEFITSNDAITWDGIVKGSALRKLLRRTIHSRGKAWTTYFGNAILSAVAHGTIPVSQSVMNDICESYELV